MSTSTQHLRTRLPGLGLAAGIAAVAYLIQLGEQRVIGHAVIEGLVIAILLGMAWRNLIGLSARFAPGVSFAAKEVLEFAIVLLGASVDLPALLRAGPGLVLIIIIAVVVALTASALIGRALGLNPQLATLVAVGNSICGNSAIAAVAPVIKAKPEDVASSIAFTAVLGVIVVISLPLLIPILDFTFYQYGVLAGLSVYAVPQVVAATFPVSAVSGQIGTLVKLARVLLLGPVVVFFSIRHGARDASAGFRLTKFVPWFIIGFLILAALRSVGLLPVGVAAPLADVARLLTIVAMAALGLSVDVRAIRKAGPRVIATVIASLLILITLSVALIRAFGIGAG